MNAFDNAHETRATVVIVFAPGPMVRLGGNIWENGVVPTLRAEAKRGDAEPVIAFDVYNQSVTEDVYRALRIGIDSGDCIMEPTMQVRRLTPIECERLMGWPDNHTATGTNGPISDTNRYKMCGNGVASPVAQWIGEQLIAIRSDAEGSRPDAE